LKVNKPVKAHRKKCQTVADASVFKGKNVFSVHFPPQICKQKLSPFAFDLELRISKLE
jgi:hypothetical protein